MTCSLIGNNNTLITRKGTDYMAPDKMFLSTKTYGNVFSYFSMKTYVVCTLIKKKNHFVMDL